MYDSVTEDQFVQGFDDYNRAENFTTEARRILFKYFEQLEEDLGTPIIFDVIAICCEYSEESELAIRSNYSIDENQDIEEYLQDYGLVGKTSSNDYVYFQH
jgi:hypothetical protein